MGGFDCGWSNPPGIEKITVKIPPKIVKQSQVQIKIKSHLKGQLLLAKESVKILGNISNQAWPEEGHYLPPRGRVRPCRPLIGLLDPREGALAAHMCVLIVPMHGTMLIKSLSFPTSLVT